jgi:hypothetical protein
VRARWVVTVAALGLIAAVFAGRAAMSSAVSTPPSAIKPGAPSDRVVTVPVAAARRAHGVRPVSVSAISAQRVWVLASVDCSARFCPSRLFRSADGGRSWQKLPPPPPQVAINGGTHHVSAIRFANPRDGWMFGSQLWATHNGGRSWRRLTVHGGVDQLVVVGRTVWIVRSRCVPDQGCHSFALLRADVATNRFRVVRLPHPLHHLGAVPALGGRGRTVAVLNNPKPSPAHDADQLEISTDDGAHWSVRSGSCYRELGGQVAPAGGVVWAVCPTGMDAMVYRSTGGAFAALQPDGRTLPNTIAVAALSPDSAVASVLGRRAYWTNDGGMKWTRARLPTRGRFGGLGAMTFPDAKHGFAVFFGPTYSAVIKTDNAGHRWVHVRLP